MHWSRRSALGVSLVEVLMVVAVVGVLAGILTPVIFRARGQSRTSRCVANLQQLGRAFHLYVADWNDVYPAPGGKPGGYNYWVQSGGGGIVRYIGSSGGLGTVWCCPELTAWQSRFPARTYSMNSYLRDPPDIAYPACINIFKGCPTNAVEVPDKTILLYEGLPITPNWPDSLDYIYRCGDWQCVRGWFTQNQPRLHTEKSWLPWHYDKNNYLYCDGHIRSFRPNKYPNHPPYDITNEWWVRKSAMAAKYGGW